MDDSDDSEIFFPSRIGGAPYGNESTGNADDDEILRQIAARTSLSDPRSWKHYIYTADEGSAQQLAGPLLRFGWQVEIFAPNEDEGDDKFLVVAEMTDVVLTVDLVRSTRELFERIVSALPGADYDGWEAEISIDESGDEN
jgi:hypothetical protein